MPARRSFVFVIALLLSFAAGRPLSAIVLQDRTTYLGAKKDYEQLARGKIIPQTRGQAEKIAERFERLPQEYPKSRYCDAAYYYAGIIHQDLYQSSKEQRSLDRAIRNFRLLVAKYPG